MENVNMKIEGNILTITVDLTQNHGPSKSGKNEIIASTKGNVSLEAPHDDIKLGLNVFKK